MDERRRSGSNNQQGAERVRIIGPDEAAEAIERGEVAPRRSGDELRFGDRPPAPPAANRPTLRFPLDAKADPTRIERPPVQPAPDPVTGPVELPHWTDPPTGEVPAVLIGDQPHHKGSDEDLDAWSSFATSTPRWRDSDDDWSDDGYVEHLAGDGGTKAGHEENFGTNDLEERVGQGTEEGPTGGHDGPRWDIPDDDWSASQAGEVPLYAGPPAGEGERTVPLADDDSAMGVSGAAPRRPGDVDTWDDDADTVPHRSGRHPVVDADGPADQVDDDDGPRGGGGDRDIVQAVGVGLALLALSVFCIFIGHGLFALLTAAALALCAAEFFGVLRKVGWESAGPLGIVLVAAFPLAVWLRPGLAFGLMTFLAVAGTLAWYLSGAGGHDPRVLEGTGATLLGVAWIGGLGAAAAGLSRMPDGKWLLLAALLATVAYDAGAFFIGRAFGRRRLSSVSPSKTWEGLAGGALAAFLVIFVIVGVADKGAWHGMGAALILGVGAALAAPLGDLCQSLLKRDLGVKDMGTVLPGHGGMLDRLDSMLFVMPTVYFLALLVGHAHLV